MARKPGAEWKPLPVGSNDPPIIPIGLILHVDAMNSRDLFNYFNGPSKGIESHGHVRLDGHSYQYRDTEREADANYKANSFIKNGKRYGYVSLETQGYADGFWTKAQIEEIKSWILFMHSEHGMPLKRCEHSQDPGVGYHTLFGSPSAWTPVAKSCPGPNRIKQFNEIIRPWMNALSESDMFTDEDRKLLRQTHRRVTKMKQAEAKRDQRIRKLIKRKYNALDTDLDLIFEEVNNGDENA